MKKFFKGLIFSSLALVSLLAVFCVALNCNKKESMIANAATQKYVVTVDYANAFRIEKLQFVYDGVTVEYQFKNEYQEGEWVYRLTAPTGVTSSITESSSSAEAGDGVTYFYFDAEAAALLEEKFNTINSLYNLPNSVPVDASTSISFSLCAKNSNTYINSFFYSVDYSTASIQATKYNIVEPQVNTDGSIALSGTYNEESDLFERTINDWPFAYNFSEETGFRFQVGEVRSGIFIDFSSTTKAYPVIINSDAIDAETLEVDYTRYIGFSSLARADFMPVGGKIIDKLELYVGKHEEDKKLFTLYGGMSDEHLDAGKNPITDYYFNSEFALDKNTTPIAVYGNFALAIESHIESKYTYTFKDPSETGANYSQLVMIPGQDEHLSYEESYIINLYSNGKVRVYTYYATAGLIFDVEVQSYTQVNVRFVNNDGVSSEDASSKALQTLKVNGVTYENIEVDGEAISSIPKTVFAIGYEGSVAVEATLKDRFNYAEKMGTDGIEGSVFATTIESGILNIYTKEEDTYFLEIRLLDSEGNYFVDATTEIFISTRDDCLDEDDFLLTEKSNTSTDGMALLREIRLGDVVKFRINIAPYKMIIDGDGEKSVLKYVEMNCNIEENTILVFTISNFEIEKLVYYNEEVIGQVRIKLISYYEDYIGEELVPNAGYEVLFKGNEETEFSSLTAEHPSRYGYEFVNLKMTGVADSKSFLVEYVDRTFIVNTNDYSMHSYLASTVFFADTEDGGKIEAVYSSKLVNIRFTYPEKGTLYVGMMYFDSDVLYLNRKVAVAEAGKYFAGLRYTMEDGTTGEIRRNENELPVYIESGSFAGMYSYKFENVWTCAENNVEIEVLTEFATFEFTVIFTESDGTINSLTAEIKYGTEFTIEELNKTFRYDAPLYPGVGTFNHIGWAIEDTENFVSADTCDFILGRTITYSWERDVRMVPVFSANTVVISFFDGMEFVNSATVSAGEEVDLKKFLFKGDWIILERFGYIFLGFNHHEKLAVDYNAGTGYSTVEENNSDIFVDDGGKLVWIASENVQLYSIYTKIEYKLILDVVSKDYATPENWTTNYGVWTEIPDGKYHIDGFTITDTLNLGGFSPKNSDAFVSLVKFGFENELGEEFAEPEFVAICDANGIVTSTNNGTRFNLDDYTMTLLVSDFINADTAAKTIRVQIEYLPITYIISFTADAFDETGTVVSSDAVETVYYKFTRENASIDKVDYWMQCDETGETILGMGWKTITTPNNELVFTTSSLRGISGISFDADNGKTYSFKSWQDLDKSIVLGVDSVLTESCAFRSIFSDKFDVAVNYYTYSTITSKYEQNSAMGYFWAFEEDGGGGGYTIGETRTANSYEIFLVGGDLYYICAWSTTIPVGFNTTQSADDMGLNFVFSVDYSLEEQEINFYAVYKKYGFSVTESSGTYTVSANLPNDPNGNAYSNEDVIFVQVLKSQFEAEIYSKFNTVDRLNAVLSSLSAISAATIAEGNVLESPAVSSDYYVFAVIQRKVDDVDIAAFYIALKLPINESI